jgi:hypothetical protein
VSSLSDSAPVEFNVSGSGEEYIDLRQAWLYVRAKVTKADGGDIKHITDN